MPFVKNQYGGMTHVDKNKVTTRSSGGQNIQKVEKHGSLTITTTYKNGNVSGRTFDRKK
jgi:hypothetical protein